MLYWILLDEMTSKMARSFLHKKQRTGDNETDNLQYSVGKKDIFTVQSVTQATAAPGLSKKLQDPVYLLLLSPQNQPLLVHLHMHFVALIFGKENFSRLPIASVKYLNLQDSSIH